ncbi:MAG: hypothetical protein NTU91_03285 [Chloroflexi bacterium]|nr:hypothetical protein [Chloroflexota bacterium]
MPTFANTVVSTETGSIVIGSAVTANLGSTPVTAYQINMTLGANPGPTAHDLGYVDTTVTPNRPYTGDSTGVNTGNTAATRPTTLDGRSYLVKQ